MIIVNQIMKHIPNRKSVWKKKNYRKNDFGYRMKESI